MRTKKTTHKKASNQSEIDTTKINSAKRYPETTNKDVSCLASLKTQTHSRKKRSRNCPSAGLAGSNTNPKRRNEGAFKYFNLIRIWCNLFYFIWWKRPFVRNCQSPRALIVDRISNWIREIKLCNAKRLRSVFGQFVEFRISSNSAWNSCNSFLTKRLLAVCQSNWWCVAKNIRERMNNNNNKNQIL